MMSENEALSLLTEYVTQLYMGKIPAGVPEPCEFPDRLRELAKSIDILGNDIAEAHRFGEQLAKGNLNVQAPGSHNYLSAAMREFHSKLLGLDFDLQLPDDGGGAEPSGNRTGLASEMTLERKGLNDAALQWKRALNSWRYHQIVSAMSQLRIMMLEIDAAGNILYANPPFKAMFPELSRIPYEGGDVEAGTALMTYLCTFGYFSELLEPDVKATDRFPMLRELYDPNSESWYKITTDRIRLVGGAYGLLHVIDDISEWKKHESQLRRSASIDTLTGAYTRGAGLIVLNEAFEERAVTKTCVAFADVDGLKAINDTYGHTEGDFTLRTVAEIFMSCVRKSDWVIRYGGDEFVIIFRDCTVKMAHAIIGRMHEKLEEANKTLGKPYRLSFSIGCTAIEKGCESVDELLAIVDRLMYDKKRENRLRELIEKPPAGPYGK